jgi:hypothetical protein
MGLTMDMFLDHKVKEKALVQLTVAQCLTGLARKNGESRVSAGLQVITDGYAIGHECLTWAQRTHLERERKEREKRAAGKLERIKLKGKVDVVLSKGPTPEEGKWKNQDLKVTIQWYKRAGDIAMPKNNEGLLLRYRETCGHVVTYQDAVVTGVTPHLANPNSTEKNFAAVALGEEPPDIALALAPALVTTPIHGAMVDSEAEDRIAASTVILALDPAAQTGRPKKTPHFLLP